MKKLFLSALLSLVINHVYAQDISKGHTFADGDTVHGSDLNALVDSATILRTFISNKSTATPLSTDTILFDQASTSTLKQASISTVVTAGGAVSASTTRTANTFLSGPASGAAAAPTFRTIKPQDTSMATETTTGSTTIDATASRTFSRALTTNTTYTISGMVDGETITVAVRQHGSTGPYTAAFTGVQWRGGTAPTQTTTANKLDIYTFIKLGATIYGAASQNYN